jgi:DNA end-binding protein Ku
MQYALNSCGRTSISTQVDEETREVVEAHEKARGYEIGKGQYLLIEDEELEAIEIASTQTIEIDSFVPRAEIDAPYYITVGEYDGIAHGLAVRKRLEHYIVATLGEWCPVP